MYLESDHWKNFRRRWALFYKDTAYCRVCKNPKYQLHHVTYDRLGREHLADVIPLCRKCHKSLHGKLKWKRQAESDRRAAKKRILKRVQTLHPAPPLDRRNLLPPQG